MGAGALWGLVFLAPELTRDFSPWLLSAGRYLAYGLLALIWLRPRWPRIAAQLTLARCGHLLWLGLTGNSLYYVLLATAVGHAGVAATALVIGFLPVAVSVAGLREADAPGLRRLWPSLLLCAAGALCIGWQAVQPSGGLWGARVAGLLCATGALLSWTCFAVGNARALRRLTSLTPSDWNLLTGVATGAQALLLLPLGLWLDTRHHAGADWGRLAAVSLGVAVLASMLGNQLWNRMSRLLPLTLVGQMILFETLFAMLYGLAWERRLPAPLELMALLLVVAGVLTAVAAHRPRSQAGRATP